MLVPAEYVMPEVIVVQSVGGERLGVLCRTHSVRESILKSASEHYFALNVPTHPCEPPAGGIGLGKRLMLFRCIRDKGG